MAKISDHTLVIIPTFNERENLPLIVKRLLDAEPQRVHVLVVDDSSPDGTGEVADQLAAKDERIQVLHREGKGGLGGAYIAGFHWGLDRGYDVLCEMDADGSHAPEQLHLLLDRVDAGADLVIGSRYVKGGKTVNWPTSRQLLSRGGNIYVALALGAGLSDITGGYRAYRREVLEAIHLDTVDSAGYVFQVDLAWRAVHEGFDVREVPITFTEREIGESKMSGNIVSEAMLQVTKWGATHRVTQVSTLVKEFGNLGVEMVKRAVYQR
ncbi:polyprenol monophosphomannose synthase [Corynebacterium heidelbergense]|uniref:dolichyl-phosphate beta-D-mannosyltransferase n=1 Tax=Corynebacterium heidelbergense TaxID=2055947 RepID=A0A364V4X3_9CORY|nr:polyprenol monophosphomannose synthase [Corynebacterium heidelbergense]RAV31693.1 polyprenol monophosphomannose synthase [Corynebacterium heidelbergense]RAV33591.1 polyprenol monophosphomannose synthase [Corynebacterium heidelbergense]WCZ36515.1 Undecaprenyl-phosphate mannosyltransferase [Corynebacterium heidelbergense]